MERLEIRLEPKAKRSLEEHAQAQGVSAAEVVRPLIHEHLGTKAPPESKQEALEKLFSMRFKDVPGPEELEEEIHNAFGT